MNNLYKEMVRKPGDLCFEVSLESDKGLTMTDLSFALKFFVYGHPKNVCIHKDDLKVVEGKYYAVLNEHGFVNGVLFCEAEIVETINGINRIVSVRSNTGYMIGNCCQPSVDTSSCAHGYSLSFYKVEYVPQPIDPNPEEDQLVAEELFDERLSLPELTADRAIADEHGNRIADTYETRQAVRNHIREVYNEQFNENPPLIMDGYITPQMLSESTKELLENTGQNITNVPDGEDLTTKQGVLKLSDKPYNPGAYSGLGRVYLRKNLVGGQNLLTQSMVSKPNTIYIIQYDYTLDGKSIIIPEGCVLSYEGGSIRDGHINYNDTLIEGKESLNNVTESGAAIHHDNEERKLNGQGMDCIILKKTPYLTQEMVSKPNTIYIIRYNYDLNGAEITIPENCVLQFEGGMFSNGIIETSNTDIVNIQSFCNQSLIYKGTLKYKYNVSYRMFGAILDGLSYDYYAVKACHNFANQYNCDVVENRGVINLNGEEGYGRDRIVVKTNTDISCCSFIIRDDLYTNSCYYIKDDNEFVDYSDLIRNNKAQFEFGSSSIDCLSNFKETLFIAKGTRILGNRPNSISYYNNEPFTILSDGVILGAPLYCDYTLDNDKSGSRELSLIGKAINTNPIIFKSPKIIYDKYNHLSPWPSDIFYIDRNNTTIVLPISIIRENYPVEDTSVNPVLNIFNCENAYNIIVTGGIAENYEHLKGQNRNVTCYIIRFTNCSDITIEKTCMFRGWGAINTEFIRNVTIRDSVLNRFDNHFGVGNINIDNLTVIGSNNFANIGYGNASINITNSRYYIEDTASITDRTLLQFRPDLRLIYKGEINVSNIYIKSDKNEQFFICAWQDGFGQNIGTYFDSNTVKGISINNISFSDSSKNKKCYIFRLACQKNYSLPFRINRFEINGLDTDFEGHLFLIEKDFNYHFKKLNINNCNMPNFKASDFSILTGDNKNIIEDVHINNSNIPQISDMLAIKDGGKAYINNSTYLHSGLWRSGVSIISVACNVIPREYSGRTDLVPRCTKFIGCTICKNPESTSKILNVDISGLNGDSASFINCNKENELETSSNSQNFNLLYDSFGKKNNEYISRFTNPQVDDIIAFDTAYNRLTISSKGQWLDAFGNPTILQRAGKADAMHSLEGMKIGFMYFLQENGISKPCWWTGSKWVDATGTEV